MKHMCSSEMRQISGGTTFTCKCGKYSTTSPWKCVTHMVSKHPKEILTRWASYYRFVISFI